MRERAQRGRQTNREREREIGREREECLEKKTQREKYTHVLRAKKLSVIKFTLTSMK
jgi:hypothetical protein